MTALRTSTEAEALVAHVAATLAAHHTRSVRPGAAGPTAAEAQRAIEDVVDAAEAIVLEVQSRNPDPELRP